MDQKNWSKVLYTLLSSARSHQQRGKHTDTLRFTLFIFMSLSIYSSLDSFVVPFTNPYALNAHQIRSELRNSPNVCLRLSMMRI